MFKDDPDISTNKRHEPKYKLASNLVRSINTDNSLMKRPHKNRIHRPVQDNRTGSYSNNNASKTRKLRRKLQKLMEKCNEGHQKACNRLRRERSNNGNLVRSLDRRSSVRSGENRNRRKLTKKERKERRKQRKMARRERRRLLRKQNRKNKKNKNRRQTRSLKQCRTKYIDSGDCPHCSSTCPPLKNLETGKLTIIVFEIFQKVSFYFTFCEISDFLKKYL